MSAVSSKTKKKSSAPPDPPSAAGVRKVSGGTSYRSRPFRLSLQTLFYSPLLHRERARSYPTGSSGGKSCRTLSREEPSGASHPRVTSQRSVPVGGSSYAGGSSSEGGSSTEQALLAPGFSEAEGSGSQTIVMATGDVHVCPEDDSDEEHSSKGGTGEEECPLCLARTSLGTLLNCTHRACPRCIKRYITIEVSEGRANLSCFECMAALNPTDVERYLCDAALLAKYEEFMLRRVLTNDTDARWCPAPDCNYAVIASGCASCPLLQCEREACATQFCYHCKNVWHADQTCDQARAQRSPNFRNSSMSFSYEPHFQSEQIKSCPRCLALIMKQEDGSCNHMTCPVCGTEFCWLCRKQVSDLHYLSPSGCTFWGRKPWSRKKMILWQVGSLIGAPVGIGLVAAIAVPAIVIGVPIYTGRRIHHHYANSGRSKRIAAVASGVGVSMVMAPMLAVTAVGIGVPILLAYVYGVVPISLCRSGVCGAGGSSSSSGGGVLGALDLDDDVILSDVGGEFPGPSEKPETSESSRRIFGFERKPKRQDSCLKKAENQSIGEATSIGGPSVNWSVGETASTADRESASVTALASASDRNHKTPENHSVRSKRSSVSSENGVPVSLVPDDSASNIALAGSVLSYKLTSETRSSASAVADSVSLMSGPPGCPLTRNLSPVGSQSEDEEQSEGLNSTLAENRHDGVSLGRKRKKVTIERQGSESSSGLLMHPERACGMGVRNVARYERRTQFGEGSSSRKPGPTKATDESKVHSGALEPTGRKRSFWRRLFPGRNRSRRNHSPIEEN